MPDLLLFSGILRFLHIHSCIFSLIVELLQVQFSPDNHEYTQQTFKKEEEKQQ